MRWLPVARRSQSCRRVVGSEWQCCFQIRVLERPAYAVDLRKAGLPPFANLATASPACAAVSAPSDLVYSCQRMYQKPSLESIRYAGISSFATPTERWSKGFGTPSGSSRRLLRLA